MAPNFKALYISQSEGEIKREVRDISISDLPQNEVLIKVHYSSLNYKDALSATGNKGVTRKFPHVPGIDAAGIVEQSSNAEIPVGTEVIVTSYDLGMNTWGGFGEYISVPASWVIKLPKGLSLKESMSFGTAGLTAGLSILKIVEAGIHPDHGPIIVSGATGGVGSMACGILKHLGYSVHAVSGKKESALLNDILKVDQVHGREEFVNQFDAKPLASAEFGAGIDNVGGSILSGILKSVQYNSLVASCGIVASVDLNTTVFPFILRGITLAGIDSAEVDMDRRVTVWQNLATTWKPKFLADLVQEICLDQVPEKLNELLAGKAEGRYVLRHG